MNEIQMGRPPLKDSQKRKNRVVLLFTDAELEEIKAYLEGGTYDGMNHLGREVILGKVRSEDK